MPKIRNILIFVAIAAVLVFAYIFFAKPPSAEQTNLVSSSGTTASGGQSSNVGTNTANGSDTSAVASNFLTLLLSVKTIQLNTDIFSDPAFTSLHDSSIVLVPDATTGRPDPFAQFGVGDTTPTSSTTGTVNPPTTASTGSTASNTSTPIQMPVVPPAPSATKS